MGLGSPGHLHGNFGGSKPLTLGKVSDSMTVRSYLFKVSICVCGKRKAFLTVRSREMLKIGLKYNLVVTPSVCCYLNFALIKNGG